MKTFTFKIALCLTLFVLFACGGKKEERGIVTTTEVTDTVKPAPIADIKGDEPKIETVVETKDVKGVITAGFEARIHRVKIATDEGKFEVPVIELDSVFIKVYPVKKKFSVLKAKLEQKLKAEGDYNIIDERKSSLFYSLDKNNKKTIYNFIVYTTGTNKQFVLTGQRDSINGFITDREVATQAYNTALSFIPAKE